MYNLVFFFNEHFILSILWIFFLIGSFFLTIKHISFKDKIIDNTQAIKLINKKNAIIVDTRSKEVFQQGHIVNSINIPLKNIILGKIKEIKDYKSLPIILILNEMNECKNCMNELLKHGFNNIFFLKNGISHWISENLPLTIKNK
ncbi:rhodanese-like domain-containing protein [Buchnera aphidicola]|uniref:Rhodanese-like domain-containing protein n=1 Tax=Buchnera aphidicola (Lipaphis pseudobrassicae) TaxID=1258543 RepID=A0A4D6Y6N6_9GAMM|nr:rhodanese-like domain-containing protein [Buchnera aphidicola]QCI21948.1 rhodanese-like domain-containing protein [Buchnera aphidicola (Lipaphis pseudobrassicae)]